MSHITSRVDTTFELLAKGGYTNGNEIRDMEAMKTGLAFMLSDIMHTCDAFCINKKAVFDLAAEVYQEERENDNTCITISD